MPCLRARSTSSASSAGDLAVAQTGRGFVEQNKLGFCGKCAREVEHLLMSEIELPGRYVAIADQAGAFEERVRVGERGLFDAGAFGAWRKRKIRRRSRRHADQHVLQDGEAAAQFDILKRPRDAPCGDGVGRHTQERTAVEEYVAFGGTVEPRDAIEDGGLAGAVRADQRVDRALGDLHREVTERAQAAEANADITQCEEGFAHRRPRRALMKPQMPRGMNMTAKMRMRP